MEEKSHNRQQNLKLEISNMSEVRQVDTFDEQQ